MIGADRLIVDPEKARRSTELEDGVLVLIAAPNQPDHKITLDFKKEIPLAKIELTGELKLLVILGVYVSVYIRIVQCIYVCECEGELECILCA